MLNAGRAWKDLEDHSKATFKKGLVPLPVKGFLEEDLSGLLLVLYFGEACEEREVRSRGRRGYRMLWISINIHIVLLRVKLQEIRQWYLLARM